MQASILAIGDELTLGERLDTNSRWIADRLLAASIVTIEHRSVPDIRTVIAGAVTELSDACELLVLTGGLGPTADDVTRAALADALTPGAPLVLDEEALRAIERWFAGRGRPMPEANRQQAMRPATMRLLPNPHGTAPGLAGRRGACSIFALPGPPREMRPMLETQVLPAVTPVPTAEHIRTDSVHAYGIGESDAETMLEGLTRRDREPQVGLTASAGVITARIRARGRDDAVDRALAGTVARVERAWAPYCYGRGEQTLPERVGGLLRKEGLTLSTAESCTGGWLGKMIVDVSGASDYFQGGWVAYADELKRSSLGVTAETLDRCGAVSAEAADAMARGAIARSGTDLSLAITGVAGPQDGGPDRPAGTVFIAVGRSGDGPVDVNVRRFRFRGDRSTVRDRSCKSALQLLRFALLGVPADQPIIWGGRTASRGGEP